MLQSAAVKLFGVSEPFVLLGEVEREHTKHVEDDGSVDQIQSRAPSIRLPSRQKSDSAAIEHWRGKRAARRRLTRLSILRRVISFSFSSLNTQRITTRSESDLPSRPGNTCVVLPKGCSQRPLVPRLRLGSGGSTY